MSDVRTYFERFPVSAAILASWIAMAVVTNVMDTDSATLLRYGASSGLEVASGSAWRLFTSSFLHANLLHIGFNTYGMMRLGPWAEGAFGSARFAALYAVGAVGCAALTSLCYDPMQPVVGGSGALFALDGALVAYFARHGGTPEGQSSLRFSRELLGLALSNMLLAALIPYVSNLGHAAGFVYGLGFGWILTPHPRTRRTEITPTTAGFAALALALVVLACFPLHRWDGQFFAWQRATTQEGRDAHRRAFGLAYENGKYADLDDAAMQAFAKDLEEIR